MTPTIPQMLEAGNRAVRHRRARRRTGLAAQALLAAALGACIAGGISAAFTQIVAASAAVTAQLPFGG